MAKMMMGQIDHARSRVRNIKNELLGKAPDRQKEYNTRDLVKGLRDGTVSFTGAQLQRFASEWAESYVNSESSYNQPSFESIVLEKAFSTARSQEKKRFTKETDVYKAKLNLINDKAVAVEDAIVLGDNAAALAALQDFAAFRV